MKKLKRLVELDNKEQEPDFSALSSKLAIKEPVPRKIRDVFNDFSRENKIILQPEFQRDFIWSKNKQAELIRSLWRGIPLPMFYFSVDSNGTLEVIDGQQRLTTIFGYLSPQSIKDKKVRNRLPKKIKIKDESKNNIDKEDILRKISDSNIHCVEIFESGLNTNDKFEIFRSLNLGATPLKIQEIRNAIFQKEMPHLNKALKKNANKTEKLLGMKNERMIFEDLVLRFFIINEKGHEKKVSDQLKNNLELKNIFSEEKVNTINSKFSRFIKYMDEIFGRKSFQVLSKIKENKNIPEKEWKKFTFSDRINQGLFHLFAYYIPKYSTHQLNKKSRKKIRIECIKLLRNPRFINLITGSGTDSTKKIKTSKAIFEKLFLNLCYGDWSKTDKRNVPREFKKTILDNIPYCYLCYGKLKRVEHIENFTNIHGEHIKSYKTGNISTYNNILLAHRKCNSEKSWKKLEEYRQQEKSILKRKKNKENIKQYIRCLNDWNKTFPIHNYKKLVKFAEKDKKL